MSLLRLLCCAVLVLTLAGCAHEDDDRVRVDPDAAFADVARDAFAAMDAARGCLELEAAWASYLDPGLVVSASPFLRCTPAFLGLEHHVRDVRGYDPDLWWSRDAEPAAVRDADDVRLVDVEGGPAPRSADTLAYAGATGWLVLRSGARFSLYHAGIGLLQECLRTQEVCRVAG